MKNRLAIWIHGGIGTGHFSQGYPMLEKVLDGLSATYDLVVYSRSSPGGNYHASNFQIQSSPPSIKSGWMRWLWLLKCFLTDHRKNKFHLLFAFWGYPSGFLATCLSKIVRIPVAVYLLGSDSAGIASVDFGIFHKPLPRRVAMWTYRHASFLLAISQFQRQQLIQFGLDKPINVIPWGVETSLYYFLPRVRSSILHVIHVGHLAPVKDQATLLKAFALIAKKQPAELRILGGDDMNGKIQNMCRDLGLEKSVQFLDMIPYTQMPAQYAWADILMHTSLSEGQGMALTEAAACGVLLAGTRVGLIHDLGEACALIVEAGEYELLAEKVLGILDTPEDWNRRVQAAKQWSEEHDLTWTILELRRCLDALIPNS